MLAAGTQLAACSASHAVAVAAVPTFMSAVMATFSSVGAAFVTGSSVPFSWLAVERSSALASMAYTITDT